MIFFDIDDTLLDYKTSQDLAAVEFAKKYLEDIVEPAQFPAIWEEITDRHMARYLSGELTFQDQRRCRIRECLNQELDDRESDKIFDEYYQLYEQSWRLFPEVEEALAKLNGVPLGIITNGDKQHQCYKIEKLGISKYFQEIITPACAGAPKPERAIFSLGAERANLPMSRCWYIGDNYKLDYVGARDAGFNSVWLNRLNRDEACDNQCKNLIEFTEKIIET